MPHIPFPHVQYVHSAAHDLGETTHICSIEATDVIDEILWAGQVDPGFDSTFRLMESQLKFDGKITPPAKLTGTVVNDATVGSVAWTDPTNVEGNNSNSASVDVAAPSTDSNYLKCTDFNFNIPADATILGIKTIITIDTTASALIRHIKMVKGGAISGNALAVDAGITNGVQDRPFGDSTELWGLSWTPAEINASNFGMVIYVGDSSGAATIEIQKMSITIYYQVNLTHKWVKSSKLINPPEKYAGTCIDDATVGTVTWSNPSRVQGNTTLFANAIISGSALTHYIKATNFGFNIPTDAVIKGILVDAVTSGTDIVVDSSVKIVKGGSISGDEKAEPISWASLSRQWGRSTVLWGLSWTAADINGNTFGVAVSAKSGDGDVTAQLNNLKITVYYELDETIHSESNIWVTDAEETYLRNAYDQGTVFSDPNMPFDLKLLITATDTNLFVITVDNTDNFVKTLGESFD